MKYFAQVKNRKYVMDVFKQENGYQVTVDGVSYFVDMQNIEGSQMVSVLMNNKSFTCMVVKNMDGYKIQTHGEEIEVQVEDERSHLIYGLISPVHHAQGTLEIKAIMPGLVVHIEVEQGKQVQKGDGLIILQAMKMENEIKSTVSGKIDRVLVKEGQTVEKGQLLLILKVE